MSNNEIFTHSPSQFKFVSYFSEGAEVWAPPGVFLNISGHDERSGLIHCGTRTISYLSKILFEFLMGNISRAKTCSLWDQCPILWKELWKLHKFLCKNFKPSGLKYRSTWIGLTSYMMHLPSDKARNESSSAKCYCTSFNQIEQIYEGMKQLLSSQIFFEIFQEFR